MRGQPLLRLWCTSAIGSTGRRSWRNARLYIDLPSSYRIVLEKHLDLGCLPLGGDHGCGDVWLNVGKGVEIENWSGGRWPMSASASAAPSSSLS